MKLNTTTRFRKLLLLFILSFLLVGIVYGYGGGKSVQRPKVKNALESSAHVWSEIPEDSTITMKINKEKISFANLTFKTKNKVSDVSIEVGSLIEKPSSLEPSGILYQYVEIVTDKIEEHDIEFVSINFKVSREWIGGSDIDESDIYLHKLLDNSWEKLKTNKISSDTDFAYFNSLTSGFSVFAITGEKEIRGAGTTKETQEEAKLEEISEPIEEKKPSVESGPIPASTAKKSKIPANAILFILVLVILSLLFFLRKKLK